MLRRCFDWFQDLIHRPMRVFWICFFIAIMGIVVDGTAFRFWSLQRDHRILSERISDARSRSRKLEFQIRRAQEPEFIERAARDQFDLVKEGDLIFIFSDDSPTGSSDSQ